MGFRYSSSFQFVFEHVIQELLQYVFILPSTKLYYTSIYTREQELITI